jgi:hypothetical protein
MFPSLDRVYVNDRARVEPRVVTAKTIREAPSPARWARTAITTRRSLMPRTRWSATDRARSEVHEGAGLCVARRRPRRARCRVFETCQPAASSTRGTDSVRTEFEVVRL